MKKSKELLRILLIFILIGCGLFYGGIVYQRKHAEPAITSSILSNELEQASDLITTDYHYTQFGKYENSLELNGWSIPLTQKNFLLQYEGTIQCGIDLKDLDITIENQTITVNTPEIKVLSHAIDESSIQIYDEKNNLFNPIQVSDYKKFAVQQKKTVLKEAKKKGLMESSKKNAKKAIKKIIRLIPNTESYQIVVNIGAK